MILSDLLLAVWITVVFTAVFLWLPTVIFPRALRGQISAASLAGGFARMALLTVLGVTGLAGLRILNAFTILLLYSAWPFLRWLHQFHWRIEDAIRFSLQGPALKTAHVLEHRRFAEVVKDWMQVNLRRGAHDATKSLRLLEISTPRKALAVLALTNALGLTLLVRFYRPLLELRLGLPESYGALLETRQLLADVWPTRLLPAFSALSAALSLLTSADPMHVLRFLGPLLGSLLVLAVGACVSRLTMSRTAALAALYSLGAYVFTFSAPSLGRQQTLAWVGESLRGSLTRQWSVGPPELGTLFLLFAFICWADREPHLPRRAAVDTVCCLLMVAISAPALLIFVPFGWAALRVQPKLALVVLAGGWILLALLTTIPGFGFPQQNPLLLTLPTGLALLCGFIFCALTQLLRVRQGGPVEAAVFIFLFLAFSTAFLLEHDAGGQYVEYDVAARKTLEIASCFPRQRWLIVAPVEQSSETYGMGGYLDLAKFVTQYEDNAGDPGFDFVSSVDDLFVYVEKRPFRAFPGEPQSVPFSALVDPTYRHYRSPAGRTSIEFSALRMCESYRRAYGNASIYYEDDVLRIYHIRRMEPSLPETAAKKPESSHPSQSPQFILALPSK